MTMIQIKRLLKSWRGLGIAVLVLVVPALFFIGDSARERDTGFEYVGTGDASTRDTGTDKEFVLTLLDQLPESSGTKSQMKETLHKADDSARKLLDNWASDSDNERLKRISAGFTQRFPDALLIGCKKCGTTFLHSILQKHSRLAFYRGEVHFFDKPEKVQLGLKHYRTRMAYSFPDQVTMEGTPKYWVTEDAPERIFMMNPAIQLILLVREPACRVLSDYFHEARLGHIKNASYSDILTKQHHKETKDFLMLPSLYDVHLTNWLRSFTRDRILIIKNEDMETPKLADILHRTETHIGVNHEFNVTVSGKDGKKICISTPSAVSTTCFQHDVNGGCKYEAGYGRHLQDLREYFKPHVSNFERLVQRKFNWF